MLIPLINLLDAVRHQKIKSHLNIEGKFITHQFYISLFPTTYTLFWHAKVVSIFQIEDQTFWLRVEKILSVFSNMQQDWISHRHL